MIKSELLKAFKTLFEFSKKAQASLEKDVGKYKNTVWFSVEITDRYMYFTSDNLPFPKIAKTILLSEIESNEIDTLLAMLGIETNEDLSTLQIGDKVLYRRGVRYLEDVTEIKESWHEGTVSIIAKNYICVDECPHRAFPFEDVKRV